MDFMTTKIRSTTCFPGEVKPLGHVVRLYEMLKNPADMKEMLLRQYSWPFLSEFFPVSLLGVSAGNCQKWLELMSDGDAQLIRNGHSAWDTMCDTTP
jgi:hypothetical protein